MDKIEAINTIIKESGVDTEKISDGYHTFEELYNHRIVLFLKLCSRLCGGIHEIWRSRVHSDGTALSGFFIMGIDKKPGKQITYHLPDRIWEFTEFAETLDRAPEWDGHTSDDVIKRLSRL